MLDLVRVEGGQLGGSTSRHIFYNFLYIGQHVGAFILGIFLLGRFDPMRGRESGRVSGWCG